MNELPLFKLTRKTKAPEAVCGECKKPAEIDGYKFKLVPICSCCRDDRAVEITRNRFERRMSK